MIPAKLKKGDVVRIIAPSHSQAVIYPSIIELATKRLNDLGIQVTFGKHVMEQDLLGTSSIKSRIEDLHDAFSDPNVKAIISTVGGENANQLLRYLDFELIKNNPKILCGFSDNTALQNAIYRKTGLVTYSGPFFSSLGMEKGLEYTIDYFARCLMEEGEYTIQPSSHWSSDRWREDQENREFIKNEGWKVLNEGKAMGKIIGGHLSTFRLLQGTEYFPDLENSILFIEDAEYAGQFDRELQSLIHLPDFKGVKALLIGRFVKDAEITDEEMAYIISTKEELKEIPVVFNVDFGHTTPIFTYPIGGECEINAEKEQVMIKMKKH